MDLELLRAYIRSAQQGRPYPPNVKVALLDMLDGGMSIAEVVALTGCQQRTLYSFLDTRRRQQAQLRRSERGRDDDIAIREQAVAARDERLKLLPNAPCVYIDMLGDPPPGRSALDERRRLAQATAAK